MNSCQENFGTVCVLTLFCLLLHPAMGQPENQDSTEKVEQIPIAFSPSEIAAEAEEASTFLSDAILRSQPRATIVAIEAGLPGREESTGRLVEQVDQDLKSRLSLTDLGDLKNSLQRQDNLLRDLRDQIRSESGRLEESLEQIRLQGEIWKLTEETARSKDYPKPTRDLIRQTLESLERGRDEIGENRIRLLTLQNSIVALRRLIRERTSNVTVVEEEILGQLFRFEGPPLWDLSQINAGRIWQRFREQILRSSTSLKDYGSSQRHWIFISGFLFLVSTLMLRATRKRLKDGVEEPEGLSGAKLVLEHPFTSSILMVASISSIFHPDAPQSWYNVILLIALIALFRLLPGFVPSQLAFFAYGLLGLRTLELINSQIPAGSSLGRLLTTLILLFSLVLLFWFKKRLRSMRVIDTTWVSVLYLASWSGIVVLSVAVICGMAGNLALAGLLAGGTVKTAFIGVSAWLVFCVFRGMLALGLGSATAKKWRLARMNRELIFRKVTRIFAILMALFVAISIPRNFSVFDPIVSAVVEIVATPVQLQALSFSLADILAFVFLAWLSFQLSRLICFILEEDFLPRFKLPRGVPAAISHLTYYGILFLGFVIALTAGGIDLSSITILAGAFGVGIGFGLQNIVNNFVSGLILLFERPVHVGDKIALAQDLSGEVMRIGIRASVVRTFDGAEVLVPNGNLISNELTNWTLSDRKRRITILVGVAYGTNPQQMIEILKEAAAAHPEVLGEPEPIALFMGFGESSLDFSLRVWVNQFEKGLQVQSDLTIAINKVLEGAGIEIPFPQRDVHLRSVEGDFKLQEGIRAADGKQSTRD